MRLPQFLTLNICALHTPGFRNFWINWYITYLRALWYSVRISVPRAALTTSYLPPGMPKSTTRSAKLPMQMAVSLERGSRQRGQELPQIPRQRPRQRPKLEPNRVSYYVCACHVAWSMRMKFHPVSLCGQDMQCGFSGQLLCKHPGMRGSIFLKVWKSLIPWAVVGFIWFHSFA